MKKFFSIFVSALVVLTLVGCGGTPTTETPIDSALKIGFGAIGNIAKSANATAEEEGQAYAYVTQVAVLVNADNTIADLVLDSVQGKIAFDATGNITTDLTSEVKTKKELGDDYGMKSTSAESGLGLEWYEQAANFEKWAVGKSVADLEGAMDAEGNPTDADLSAGVSITIDSWVAATKLAVENAVDSAATSSDTLKLGTNTGLASHTESATADAEGSARISATFAAYTLGSDNTITAAITDAMNVDVAFDNTGAITTDLATTYSTKNVLKEEYNMKASSELGLEWYEQAANFNEFVVGKSVTDLAGVVDAEGNPADADLATKVSVTISGWVKAYEKGLE